MVGLDFGTTNSAVALAERGGAARLATFPLDGRQTATFRSVLYFSPERSTYGQVPRALAGPEALTAYRDAGGDAGGRFMQSLKSFLASRLFDGTFVFGWPFTLEQLVALMLGELRTAAMQQLGADGDAVLIGRPVHFVVDAAGDVDPERDRIALERLTRAAELAGFGRVAFAYEPVAAAYEYERGLDHDELVLIGDFGGGTSDFCLVRLGPGARGAGDRAESILAVDGVPLAGNAFDARLVRAVVSPALGLGSKRRSEVGKELPIPSWIYSRLERWEDLSLLAVPETLDTLRRLRQQAIEADRLDNLIHLVRHDLGYALYQEVERTKLALSGADAVEFVFDELPDTLRAPIARPDFEGWIDADLVRIAACVDRLLLRCGVPPSAVERVFLTGGSSLVPSVRAIFAERFGAERVRGGDELITVARGLALIAAES